MFRARGACLVAVSCAPSPWPRSSGAAPLSLEDAVRLARDNGLPARAAQTRSTGAGARPGVHASFGRVALTGNAVDLNRGSTRCAAQRARRVRAASENSRRSRSASRRRCRGPARDTLGSQPRGGQLATPTTRATGRLHPPGRDPAGALSAAQPALGPARAGREHRRRGAGSTEAREDIAIAASADFSTSRRPASRKRRRQRRRQRHAYTSTRGATRSARSARTTCFKSELALLRARARRRRAAGGATARRRLCGGS